MEVPIQDRGSNPVYELVEDEYMGWYWVDSSGDIQDSYQ